MKSSTLTVTKHNSIKQTNQQDNIKRINKEMNKFWEIIISENKIEKATGFVRNYDLKALLHTIESLANDRIISKLDSVMMNMGYTDRKDMPENCIYPLIYELSELSEQFDRLEAIPTINATIKQRIGKKRMKYSEEITSDYIKKLQNKLQLRMNTIRKKLTEVNIKALQNFNTNSKYLYFTYGYNLAVA